MKGLIGHGDSLERGCHNVALATEQILSEAPEGLRAALAAREARVEEAWREGPRRYLRAGSVAGPLFARFSTAEADVVVFAYEARVRSIVGEAGPLRAPPALAEGPGWLLERRVEPEPWAGAESVEAVLAAAAAIAVLSLPAAPGSSPRRTLAAWRRRLRLARYPHLLAEVARARRILAAPGLPEVTSHGDFHRGNVLLAGGAAWVVDWEGAGRRAAGWDLMHYWATLEAPEDRERLYAGALRLVGEDSAVQLARLRYALTVVTAADKLAHPQVFDRDVRGGKALVALLPDLRAEAGQSGRTPRATT